MIEFTVNQSVLTCQWAFNETFIRLPLPGDDHFPALYKSLKPFGITFSSITVEEHHQSLVDRRLVIPLFDGKLRLRLTYGGFDFFLSDLSAYGLALEDLFKALSLALQPLGADMERGETRFIYEGYIQLHEMTPDEFFDQHLIGHKGDTQLVPDAFTYRIVLSDSPGSPQFRINIGRSISSTFPSAIYVNLISDYKAPGEVGKFVNQAINYWHSVLATLNLKLKNLEGNDDASTK